jgi:hypothetical protein
MYPTSTEQQVLAAEISSNENLEPGERSLLFLLCMNSKNPIKVAELARNFEPRMRGLIDKGFVRVEDGEHGKLYHLSTKPEYKTQSAILNQEAR